MPSTPVTLWLVTASLATSASAQIVLLTDQRVLTATATTSAESITRDPLVASFGEDFSTSLGVTIFGDATANVFSSQTSSIRDNQIIGELSVVSSASAMSPNSAFAAGTSTLELTFQLTDRSLVDITATIGELGEDSATLTLARVLETSGLLRTVYDADTTADGATFTQEFQPGTYVLTALTDGSASQPIEDFRLGIIEFELNTVIVPAPKTLALLPIVGAVAWRRRR